MSYTIYTDANLYLSTEALTDAPICNKKARVMRTQIGNTQAAREFSCIRLTPAIDRGMTSAYYVIPRPITAEIWYKSSITFLNIDWSTRPTLPGKDTRLRSNSQMLA